MQTDRFPRMMVVRQKYPRTAPLDVQATVARELARVADRIKPGMRIAVGTGSRGISNIAAVVRSTVDFLKQTGAKPFIIPAMGSHGGATSEGQREVLASYGITEESMGVSIEASMEAVPIGKTDSGLDVSFSVPAKQADGIIVINRIKPHTDFRSKTLGSGIIKMLVIGFGKHAGAAAFHRGAIHHGFEPVLRELSRVILKTAPILCGIGMVEDQFHQTVEIAVLPREEIEAKEAELFAKAKALMPKLPFDDIDLLIVDRIGKNISGAGMDPNITGRGVEGYSTLFTMQKDHKPIVRRLFVRDLTPETHGNGIGIGLADMTTTRLVKGLDLHKVYTNALTSLSTNSAKIPIHFESDREALNHALDTLAMPDTSKAKVVRIADTLSLETVAVSDAYLAELKGRADLEKIAQAEAMTFDRAGNLPPIV